MLEREPCGVKELTLQAETPGVTVFGVSGDRIPDGQQMRSNLVRSPSLQPDTQQSGAFKRLLGLEMGHRVTRVVGVGGHPRAHAAVAAERRVDRPATGR